jgi:uncharacterized protein (TIGR03085 family)
MTSMAQTERAELCDRALQVGADQPTLCGGWTVKDLVVHLLVREGSPAAVGIPVRRLAGLTDLASRRLVGRDFTVLVERLRNGPPLYSPFRLGRVDVMLNTLEFFIHHEDVRRAQPDWEPRGLTPRQQKLLWRHVGVAGRRLVRDAGVGVVLERTGTADRVVLAQDEPSVVVRGLPGELAVYLYGRKAHARVEVEGPDAAVAALDATELGL